MKEFLKSATAGASTGLLGKQSAPNNLGYDAMLILTPLHAEFADKDLALTESEWVDKINQGDDSRYRVLPIAYEMESSPEEDVYATSSLGFQSFVREGKDTVKYSVLTTPFVMTQLRSLNGGSYRAFIVTSAGFIKGTNPNGTSFKGFSIQNFRVEKEVKATGDAPATVPISITYGDAGEWADYGAFVEPLKDGTPDVWNPLDLVDVKAIIPVFIDQVSASSFIVQVQGYDGVAFEGGQLGDFILKDSAGQSVSIDAVAEQAGQPGFYNIEAVMTSGETYKFSAAPVGSTTTLGYAGLPGDTIDVIIP